MIILYRYFFFGDLFRILTPFLIPQNLYFEILFKIQIVILKIKNTPYLVYLVAYPGRVMSGQSGKIGSEWPSLARFFDLGSDRDLSTGSANKVCAKIEKSLQSPRVNKKDLNGLFGGLPGARTRDPLIKSQVLYRLS